MSSRHDLIHKAASLPVGHPKRKQILQAVSHVPWDARRRRQFEQMAQFPDLEVVVVKGRDVQFSTAFPENDGRNDGELMRVFHSRLERIVAKVAPDLAQLGLEVGYFGSHYNVNRDSVGMSPSITTTVELTPITATDSQIEAVVRKAL